MKNLFLGALVLLLGATSCADDERNEPQQPEENFATPEVRARITEQVGEDLPFTGILEIYPCYAGGSGYFGNYINGELTVFNGFYTIVKGDVFGNTNRRIHLPIGTYNMVYWGTPKHEEPIHNSPEMQQSGLTKGADLSEMYFSLRPYGDGTYKPVYDLVHAVRETQVGVEDLQTDLVRVSAGLVVNLRQKNNAVFNEHVKDVKVHIGSIAEKLNFYTAEPVNQTKTVRFDLTRSDDGRMMSNATVILFPSGPNPKLELIITLADNSVHRLSQTLNSSLSANTLLTLYVIIGEILPEGNPGDFTISDWDEKNETIEFPVVE